MLFIIDYVLFPSMLTFYVCVSYSRILIGSRQWSIRGKTHDWRHHYKVSFCVSKWRKVLRIFKIIFHVTRQRLKVQKRLVEALNRYERQEEIRKSRFFCRKWLRKNTRAVSVGIWARLNQTRNWSCLPQVLLACSFNSCSVQSHIRAFRLTGLLRWQNLLWFFQHFL